MLPSGRNPDWQLSERTIPAGHNTAKAEIIPLHNGTDSEHSQLSSSLGQLHKGLSLVTVVFVCVMEPRLQIKDPIIPDNIQIENK